MSSLLDEVKECLAKLYNIIFHFGAFSEELRENNRSMVYNYIEIGDLQKAKSRLKIVLTLFPKDKEFLYLYAFTSLMTDDEEESMYSLKKINSSYKQTNKFIQCIKEKKSTLIKQIYRKYFSLFMVEDFLENNTL